MESRPSTLHCPLIDGWINDYDCIENQDVVGGIISEGSLPATYKQHENWREICAACPWNERGVHD